MKLAKLSEKTRRINEGAWIDNLPFMEDIAIKVRGIGNPLYKKRLGELVGNLTDQERDDPKKQQEVETTLILETILVDWKNIDDMPFNQKNARMLLTEPQYRLFRDAVITAASTVAERGRDKFEADRKN